MALEENPDAGVRIVSPQVSMHETEALGVHPTFVVIESAMDRAVVGFGDNSIRALSFAEGQGAPTEIANLEYTPLSAQADIGGKGVLVGTDGGQLMLVAGSEVTELLHFDSGWVENIAVQETAGLRAASAGRVLIVSDAEGNRLLRRDDHPSTISGLSFSPDGNWIAAAHYNGVTVWKATDPTAEPVHLEWHGSHTSVAWSPNGAFIVTAMQDREMHCWRWDTQKGMRMSGYPSKIRSLTWTSDSRFIAASGADTVTSWDCTGEGPSGKPPLEFGYVYNGIVMHVAAHPIGTKIAGGYNDGTVVIGNVEQETAMIARAGGSRPIVGLSWNMDGSKLVSVDDRGSISVMSLLEPMA